MSYFTPRTISFFEHLAGHNHKDWFDEHRQRYHDEVKDRFDHFLKDLIARIHIEDPRVMIEPKHAKFRINRDIRFSKNKEPYKLHVSGVISPGGRKDIINPGLYVQLGNNGVHFGSGSYAPSKEHLQAIREAIAKQPKKAQNIIEATDLKEIFGPLQGEKNKRLPKEFREQSTKVPLLWNKQYYFYKSYPAKTMLRKDLIAFTMTHRHATKAWRTFISHALQEFA